MRVSPETRFIGLALLDSASAMDAAMRVGLSADWMPTGFGQTVWECVSEMEAKGLPVDEHFVVEYAKKKGYTLATDELEAAVKRAPSRREGADALVDHIREEYIRRESCRIGEELAETTTDPVGKVSKAAESMIRLATLGRDDETPQGLVSEIRKEWRESLEGKIIGLSMPWDRLYWKCGSVEPGQVMILAAVGGTGKSSACLQWALHLAQRRERSLVFSFEDTRKDALKRMAGMEGDANVFALRLGKRYVENHANPEDQWEKMLATEKRASEALDRVIEMPIHIEDRRASNSEMMAIAQRISSRAPLSAIFVDAFKDIPRGKDGVSGDDETMLGLVEMAKRIQVPVICTHHIRKVPAGMKDNRYEAARIDHSDLKGSGLIWDAARMVLAIQSLPTGRFDDSGKEQIEYYLDILKANHGLAGVREPVFRDQYLRWNEGRI